MLQNQTALTQIAQQSEGRAEQLYTLTEPGLEKSEDFYSALSSGDPAAIMHVLAPGIAQVEQAGEGAKKQILSTPGGGGEKNLALENVDVNKANEVGKMASGAYTGSFNALGQLAGQGVGESISETGAGTSAYSAGSQTLASLGNLQIQDKQLQMEQKGQTLGALGSLGQTGIEGISGAMGGGGWEGAFAAMAA